ncbi:PREDICTED: uncharacterized protein LOC107329625 [Acropora digitifera]|uniref:uncharacterized protein LOC107329625 n=1 Tax=Acropora digitifera TaxID=70779 RepID=UPI00077A0A24|nr:PREDICTED: uncharacterized protein LOC107329625 [Acropora digitifera]
MSNMSMEASSLSFNSEDWANREETKPFSAVYAVKKEVQTGICQYGGMACLVMIKVGKSKAMNLVTSSDVIADLKADKKPTEMHPFLMKKDCHLVVESPVNKFGPFSFLSIDPQSSPGLEMNPQPTCLDFQVPKQNLESEFEAYTFHGSKKLKLKFVYQRGTGKYILSTKEKKQLELSLVLGAPIIIENEDVLKKHLSSRWSVVGVIGLNEERELCPYFVTTDLFDSRPVQREEERSVPDNELNTSTVGHNLLRTLPDTAPFLEPLERAIADLLVPAITEHVTTQEERDLLELPVRLSGLGLVNPARTASQEYEASIKITGPLVQQIIKQAHEPPDETEITTLQGSARREKDEWLKMRCE